MKIFYSQKKLVRYKKLKIYRVLCGLVLAGAFTCFGVKTHADDEIDSASSLTIAQTEQTVISSNERSESGGAKETEVPVNLEKNNLKVADSTPLLEKEIAEDVSTTPATIVSEGEEKNNWEVINSTTFLEDNVESVEVDSTGTVAATETIESIASIKKTKDISPVLSVDEKISKLPSVAIYDNSVKTEEAIEDDQVRQSTHYVASVMTDENGANKQEAFVHMSVPRSGNGKIGYSKEDGAEFAAKNGMTQSWTSFTYSTDVWVNVSLIDGVTISSIDDVIVTPAKYAHFEKKWVDDHTVAIKIPYLKSGIRLSVEVKGEMMNVYANDGTWGAWGVDAKNDKNNSTNYLVATEPRHSMIIVANPELDAADIPTEVYGKIQYMEAGQWQEVDTDTDVLYIKKGLHYMTNQAIAKLDNVKWIYFEEGAYVKGAFDFQNNPTINKITGYGILSTEQYGYEMNSKTFKYNEDGNEGGGWVDNIKALRFWATDRVLDIVGLTVANPSYHTMVAYGDEDHFTTNFTRYNQFGAWFWQTDAPEVYGGGTMKDSFIMSNDDTFKLYHSNSTYDNIVVWKEENGPVFQWGWTGRHITNINVSNVDVIHSRMHWNFNGNTGLFNSANNLGDGRTGEEYTIDGLHFKNIRVNDRLNILIRLHENGNLKNFSIDGLYINDWTETKDISTSTIEFEDSGVLKNFSIANYFVNGKAITFENKNWESNQLGRLNFDVRYWGDWSLIGYGLTNKEALKREQDSIVYRTPFLEAQKTGPTLSTPQHYASSVVVGKAEKLEHTISSQKNEDNLTNCIARESLVKAEVRSLPHTGENKQSGQMFIVLGLCLILFDVLLMFIVRVYKNLVQLHSS